MKTASDPRHQKRISLVQEIFAVGFDKAQINDDVKNIVNNLDKIDKLIIQSAPEWPLDKIAKIDLATLRVALYELTVEKKEPTKVIIDEAVEIAKEFGNPNSAHFINGVLGTIIKLI